MSDASPKQSCATLTHIYSQQEEAEVDAIMTPGDDSETISCPLFMEGLPVDFSTNPALAALASLLEEEDVKEPSLASVASLKPSHSYALGGGKVRKTKSTKARKTAPYPKQRPAMANRQKNNATVAEASLFLKMWKL